MAARNPYQPGVGTTPPYLADREEQLQRFGAYLRDFPDKRRNVRVSGLRGVGKTVLLKEYRVKASEREWVVIRRDLTARLCDETDFAPAVADDLSSAIRAFSNVAKLRALLSAAGRAVGEITVGVPGGPRVSVKPASVRGPSVLEDRLSKAFVQLGRLAAKAERGVAFLYDEAHTVFDRPARHQYPLSALLGALVVAQDEEDPPLPVMLVVSGLPPLAAHLQAARSHTERLFRVEELGNLSLRREGGTSSKAAMALTRPAEATGIRFQGALAEQIAKDVDGYPYFIQKYGEALWDAADAANVQVITSALYKSTKGRVQDALDAEFFEGRYGDATRADRMTLRVAGSLGGEQFEISALASQLKSRKANATQQSINRLLKGNHVYRMSQGIYAYTAPLFGDFLRRKYPRQADDR
ncbi:MAG TPA: ATP-binding protein [Solirubrobacteraceae bacterium]|nr:ATP-binding protein [Solirubrobacteraceae bacterium]